MEALSLYQSSEPSKLLCAIDAMACQPAIKGAIMGLKPVAHNGHDFFTFKIKRKLCRAILNHKINPTIVDMRLQSQLGQGDTDGFIPYNLRIVQPAFTPLLCALDWKMQQFFSRQHPQQTGIADIAQGAENQTPCPLGEDTTTPSSTDELSLIKKQCGTIFAPRQDLANVFVLAGPAGLGKRELLNAALHRAAQMKKHLILVRSGKEGDPTVTCTHIDHTTSTLSVSSHPVGNYTKNYARAMIQLYQDIAAMLYNVDSQDTLVIVDPPECEAVGASFSELQDFIRRRDVHEHCYDVVTAYNSFYKLLSKEFPHTFFAGTHPTLPRKDNSDRYYDSYRTNEPVVSHPADPHFTYPGLFLTVSAMENTCKLIKLKTRYRELQKQAEQDEETMQETVQLQTQKNKERALLLEQFFAQQLHRPYGSVAPSDGHDADNDDDNAYQAAADYDQDEVDLALDQHFDVTESALFRKQLNDAQVHAAPTYRAYFTFLSLDPNTRNRIVNSPDRRLPDKLASTHLLKLYTASKLVIMSQDVAAFRKVAIFHDVDDSLGQSTTRFPLYLALCGYRSSSGRGCRTPVSQGTVLQQIHRWPGTPHVFAFNQDKEHFQAIRVDSLQQLSDLIPPPHNASWDSITPALAAEHERALSTKQHFNYTPPTQDQPLLYQFPNEKGTHQHLDVSRATHLYNLGQMLPTDASNQLSNTMLRLNKGHPTLNSVLIYNQALYGVQLSDDKQKLGELADKAEQYENFVKVCLGLINAGVNDSPTPGKALSYGGFIYLTTLATPNQPELAPTAYLHTYTGFDDLFKPSSDP